MSKIRISTTVDETLIAQARSLDPGSSDASVLERALRALLESHQRTRIDAAYKAAYAAQPLDEPDAWGDLASFDDAVGRP